MSASAEITTVLQKILDWEWDRSAMARWLAEHSLRFLESSNEIDRMIVADLDVALGEIQRGAAAYQLLVETANLLTKGLGLELPGREIVVNRSNVLIDIVTGTGSWGSSNMYAYVLS